MTFVDPSDVPATASYSNETLIVRVSGAAIAANTAVQFSVDSVETPSSVIATVTVSASIYTDNQQDASLMTITSSNLVHDDIVAGSLGCLLTFDTAKGIPGTTTSNTVPFTVSGQVPVSGSIVVDL